MKARDLPVGSIVATADRVWIKRENDQMADSPFYETWWVEATVYALQTDDHYVERQIERGARILREGTGVTDVPK